MSLEEDAERKIQEFKKQPVPTHEELEKSVWNLLAKKAVGNGTVYSNYSNLSQGVWTPGKLIGIDTGFEIKEEPDQHHQQGVCQESYDKGYEDGLAAKEGTTRIK